MIQFEHLGPQGTGRDATGTGIAQLVIDPRSPVNQNPTGILAKGGRAGAEITGFFRENRPKLDFQGIIARTIGMLIRKGTLVTGKGGQELGNLAEGRTVAE